MALEFTPRDEALVRSGMAKEYVGEKPTVDERRAMARWERHDRERRAWEIYGAIPKKHYREMSGRSDQVINQQAQRYGLSALRGPAVDLRKFLRELHDFLAANWLRFEEDIEEAAILSGGSGNSPNMERYRGFKADLAGLEVEKSRGDLTPRADARAGMLIIMTRVRAATEQLDREFGPEARGIVDEALDLAEEDIRERFQLGQSA